MSERVSFQSDGLKLAGGLHAADGDSPGRRRPGFLVLHGFGSSKDSGGSVATATLLAELGYASRCGSTCAAAAKARARAGENPTSRRFSFLLDAGIHHQMTALPSNSSSPQREPCLAQLAVGGSDTC
jgi:hypothetical protein